MLTGAPAIDPRKVAAYIRWSTEEQGHGTTLEVQQERVGHFIRSQGWEPRDDLMFVDDGCSGGSLERPAMARLREAVAAGEVECVVVYKLDRLSRSLLDTVNLVRQEWKGRCALFSATEHFDTGSPVGQMVFNILVSFAEFERNLIRERTLSGKRKRAQQGRNAGQKYPYGYRKGADGAWALDGVDETSGSFIGPAAVVRRIFTSFLEGSPLTAIAETLNADGIPTPEGRPWRFGAVGRILANPCYAGTYRYGERTTEGAIPPIVSADDFRQAQRLRRERAGRLPDKAKPGRYLLSGLARCAQCGSAIAGSMGKTRRYYVCTGRAIHRRCECAYMDADRLETALLAEVRGEIPVAAPSAAVEQSRRHALAEARKLVRGIGRQKERLESQLLSGALDGRLYSELVKRAEQRLADARLRLEAATQALGQQHEGSWDHMGFEQRRASLQRVLTSVAVYQPKAPGRGRRGNGQPLLVRWQLKCTNQWREKVLRFESE